MPEFLPDFHVVSLQYTLLSSQHVTYVNPVARKFDTEEAHFRLGDGKLTCEMKVHCSTAEAARSLVEPVLRALEVDSDLRWNRGELRFAFDVADIVDRTPPQPGVIQGAICVVLAPAMLSATGTVSVHVSRASYPEPPPHTFRLNPDAQSILDRYCGLS